MIPTCHRLASKSLGNTRIREADVECNQKVGLTSGCVVNRASKIDKILANLGAFFPRTAQSSTSCLSKSKAHTSHDRAGYIGALIRQISHIQVSTYRGAFCQKETSIITRNVFRSRLKHASQPPTRKAAGREHWSRGSASQLCKHRGAKCKSCL